MYAAFIIPYPTVIVAIIFAIILVARLRSLSKKQKGDMDSFWGREREAAVAAPAVDLDSLPYITIPLDKFPLGICESEEAAMIEDELRELSHHRLLNLTGKTNTELRLTYGAANIKTMQAISDDFDRVTVLLVDYAKALMEEGHTDGAITVLEFGAREKTDMRSNYTLLADIYESEKQAGKLLTLADIVETLDHPWALKTSEDFRKRAEALQNEDFSE